MARLCFGFVPSPHTGGDNTWRSTLGAHRVAEITATVGAVSKHVAGIVRQSIGAGLAVINVGGCDGDFLDKGHIRISADMGLEAMSRPSALMLDPTALIIVLTGRGDDRRIDKCAGLGLDSFGWPVIASNRLLSRPFATRAFRKRTKAVRSGVGSEAEKSAEPSERSSVVQRLGELDVGQSDQITAARSSFAPAVFLCTRALTIIDATAVHFAQKARPTVAIVGCC